MEEQREAVQRMQDYIVANLCKRITLAHLSTASLYSPWYSYQLFVQWMNMTTAVIEMQWDSTNPRIQLEPIGTRGSIELLAVT